MSEGRRRPLDHGHEVRTNGTAETPDEAKQKCLESYLLDGPESPPVPKSLQWNQKRNGDFILLDEDDLIDDIPDDVKPKPNPDGYMPGPRKMDW